MKNYMTLYGGEYLLQGKSKVRVSVVGRPSIVICLVANFLSDNGARFLGFALSRSCFRVSKGALLVLYRRKRRRCSPVRVLGCNIIVRAMRSGRSLARR